MSKFKTFKEKVTKEMNEEHEGAVAFEYIIILIIMAVAIFKGFTVLSNQIISKANEIAEFIANNGQKPLGTDGVTPGQTNNVTP